MPSARRKWRSSRPRLAALARASAVAACAALLAGTVAGCSTTQEKAEHQRARAEHILEARKQRQQRKQHQSSHPDKKGSEKG